MTTIYLLE